MTTKLTLYNGALLHVGERSLAALTDQSEPRRLLDVVYDNGGIKHCLEQAQWHFAMRTTQVDYDASIEPGFGYRRAFSKPSDWVLTSGLCQDEFMNVPLTQYRDEAGYWYADIDPIYVSYVSNDTNYGMDMNKWPETFREFVEAHFASRIVLKLTNNIERTKEIHDLRKEKLRTAKNKAAMAEPTSFPAAGSWTNARRGNSRRARNSRTTLIG